MQDIIIKKDKENNGFEVIQGDKRTGTLGFDGPVLKWLKTEEQHRLFKESLKNIKH